jgi:TRAP-type mannitol/chloroaromatic compound transport system permease small subunit
MMPALLALSRAIDRVLGLLGRAAAWLSLAMVLFAAFNALARYAGRYAGRDLSSNAFVDLQWMLFSALFLLSGAQVLGSNGHVRVDVLSGRFSARVRAWIDLCGTALFLLPFAAFLFWLSWPYAANSFAVREGSPDPGGLARYPIKALIPVGFALLFLQGVSELIKRVGDLGRAAPTLPTQPERQT